MVDALNENIEPKKHAYYNTVIFLRRNKGQGKVTQKNMMGKIVVRVVCLFQRRAAQVTNGTSAFFTSHYFSCTFRKKEKTKEGDK